MDSYLPLLIVPLVCVPIQHLYLTAGQRYDLGAVTYIATGTFLCAVFTAPQAHAQVQVIAVLLALLSLVVYLARCLILAYGTPKDFTLFTFCQLWGVPAFIGYEIERTGSPGATGISVPSHTDPRLVTALALAAVALLTFILLRRQTSLRLLLITESPLQYSFVFGSPLRLAWNIETYALLSYMAAGVAFRFFISDISDAQFRTESIWCLLSASVIIERWKMFVVVGPIVIMVLRKFLNQNIEPQYSLLSLYLLLACCLFLLNATGRRSSRETAG